LECSPEKAKVKIGLRNSLIYIGQAHYHGVSHVIITGGEPMLYPDEVRQIISFTSKLGMYTDLRTNGYWASDREATRKVLANLLEAGLGRIGLSYDSYHAEYIPIENIKNILVATRELKIETYIDWVSNEDREWVKSLLDIDDTILRYTGQPLKVGRAARELDDKHFSKLTTEEVKAWGEVSDFCNFEYPAIMLFPGGYASYSPCCWVNPMLLKKVTGVDWLESLIQQMDNSPAINYMRESGLKGLVTLAEERGLLKDHYSHPCEICFDLLPILFPSDRITLPWYLRNGHKLSRRKE